MIPDPAASSVGTEKPKYGSVRKEALRSDPSRAVVTSVRVALIGMRRPTPYLPPVQPEFTSQQSTSYLAMNSRSMLPYSCGGRGRNGAPKHVENSGSTPVRPFSVPATLAV